MVGHLAEGVAIAEANTHREAVVDGATNVYVLHRVLYPQVHVNGIKKKRELRAMLERGVELLGDDPSWPLATIVKCCTASRIFRIERVPPVRAKNAC